MKYLFTALCSLICISHATAQEITVSPTGFSGQNDVRTFSLEQAHVTKNPSGLIIRPMESTPVELSRVRAFSFSPASKLLSVLQAGETDTLQAQLFDSRGRALKEFPLEHFSPGDHTLDVTVFDDGRQVVRDNVANFTFLDTDGSRLYSLSNSTGTAGGETVSEFKADRYGRTVVLYNPQIRYDEQTGSRARIVRGEDHLTNLYESPGRVIKGIHITENGSYITVISGREGTDDRILLFDRFGNPIREITTGETVAGTTLTGDAKYLTIFSESRAQVYRVRDLEQIGSTSLRAASVFYAAYYPEDQQILALSGTIDGGEGTGPISGPEVHAIHLAERQIARTRIDFPLSVLNRDRIRIVRREANRYSIEGFNRHMEVQAGF
ncbi:MAG: hypothetical protein WD035_01395 [Balneolaceae bacterium]